jgi:hypothetical protein
MMRKWQIFVLGLLAVSGLAMTGAGVRRGMSQGCSLDGQPVNALVCVHVVDEGGRSHEFCCIRCAELWLEQQPEAAKKVLVIDEATGQELDAGTAYFVRSQVVTNAATGNRLHAFARQDDAQRHANAYGGTMLPPAERPFTFRSEPAATTAPHKDAG